MASAGLSRGRVPGHVPPELVWDYRLDDFNRESDDPYLAASRLYDGPGIIWATDAGFDRPGWVLTRHALIQEAFIDSAHFSSARTSHINDTMGSGWRLIPLEVDPPEHQAYRRILNGHFTPEAVRRLDGSVRQICTALIQEFENDDGCEFIGQFATPFPSHFFLAMMGMSTVKLPQILEWTEDLMRGTNAVKRMDAARAISRFLRGFINEQRANPQTDLMKGVLLARIEERPLFDIEVLGICYLLYIGGLDTIHSTLGWIMRYLARDQALQARLRANPDDIPRAVDDFTRAFAVTAPHRTIAADFEFHGVPMRKGDDALLPTYLASRDPQAYDNPHVVDPDRRARGLAFAAGAHTCLGIHLAKRELRIVIEAFLSRFRNIRIREGRRYEYHTGAVFGIDRLPLQWSR
jgi:cytochrome P450